MGKAERHQWVQCWRHLLICIFTVFAQSQTKKKNTSPTYISIKFFFYLFLRFHDSFPRRCSKTELKTVEVGSRTLVATRFQHSANDMFQLCAITKLVQRVPCRLLAPLHSCQSHHSGEVLHHEVHAAARCWTERRTTPAGTQRFIEAHEYFMPFKTGPHDFACQGLG